MKAVRREGTRPEILVRKILHGVGLRFRITKKSLPGTPDIVLTKHKTAIFVHGCFWHRHPGCRYATTPKTRQEYWLPKFAANVERDARKTAVLEALGWRVLVVWECETRDLAALEERLRREFSLPSLPSPAHRDDAEY
ncbi:DNA mismatch endonuclease Vsr [Pseudomonas sp. R-28-1W-6]|uniref:very short patch repair endonuclease n=1 Tax=Pseudomonas sp. R-28-1W-6 TaxID=2650101 RepID=UPI001365C950|nr:DNA mismatch endonuclease Vsr [Pseudomonas sp. R-28-1W-6]MWV13737.1 DNA mismatch endonuclease Vsr [Pseudomonas sp. R-28-1W-6]